MSEVRFATPVFTSPRPARRRRRAWRMAVLRRRHHGRHRRSRVSRTACLCCRVPSPNTAGRVTHHRCLAADCHRACTVGEMDLRVGRTMPQAYRAIEPHRASSRFADGTHRYGVRSSARRAACRAGNHTPGGLTPQHDPVLTPARCALRRRAVPVTTKKVCQPKTSGRRDVDDRDTG